MTFRKSVASSLFAAFLVLTSTSSYAQAPGTDPQQGGVAFIGLLPGGAGWTFQSYGAPTLLTPAGPAVLASNPNLGLAYILFTAHPQKNGVEGVNSGPGLCATRIEPDFTFAPGTTFSVIDQDKDGLSEIFVATPDGNLIILPEALNPRGCDTSDIG